jgi:HEAT repeat protein
VAARSEERGPRRLELLARGRRLPPDRRRALVSEELLIQIGPYFEPLFWVAAAVWIVFSAGTLVVFARRERRRRRLEALRDELRRGGDAGRIAPALLEALAADPALGQDEAAPLARLALDGGRGARIRRDAARSRPWWRRISALRVLSRAGDAQAPDLLRQALFSGHRRLAAAAAALLGEDRTRRSAEILVEGLISDVHRSSRLATAIERNGSPVADLVRPLMKRSDSRLRYWAAYLAARWPNEAGLDDELAALTDDADPLVRKAAIQSLAALHSPRVRDVASRLLDDSIDFVRSHAARALESAR